MNNAKTENLVNGIEKMFISQRVHLLDFGIICVPLINDFWNSPEVLLFPKCKGKSLIELIYDRLDKCNLKLWPK